MWGNDFQRVLDDKKLWNRISWKDVCTNPCVDFMLLERYAPYIPMIGKHWHLHPDFPMVHLFGEEGPPPSTDWKHVSKTAPMSCILRTLEDRRYHWDFQSLLENPDMTPSILRDHFWPYLSHDVRHAILKQSLVFQHSCFSFEELCGEPYSKTAMVGSGLEASIAHHGSSVHSKYMEPLAVVHLRSFSPSSPSVFFGPAIQEAQKVGLGRHLPLCTIVDACCVPPPFSFSVPDRIEKYTLASLVRPGTSHQTMGQDSAGHASRHGASSHLGRSFALSNMEVGSCVTKPFPRSRNARKYATVFLPTIVFAQKPFPSRPPFSRVAGHTNPNVFRGGPPTTPLAAQARLSKNNRATLTDGSVAPNDTMGVTMMLMFPCTRNF